MGYRSDVLIAHAFLVESHMQEVLTAFSLDRRFAEYDLADYISIGQQHLRHEDKWYYYVVFIGEDWKWYEESIIDDAYADVACINSFLTLCQSFNVERGFPYGYLFYRVGEDADDVEERSEGSDCEYGDHLKDFLSENVFIQRAISNDLPNLKKLKEVSHETLPQESTL